MFSQMEEYSFLFFFYNKLHSKIMFFFLLLYLFSSPARSAQSYCCHLSRPCIRLRVRPRPRPRHTFG